MDQASKLYLKKVERTKLENIVHKGQSKARAINRARVLLLKSDGTSNILISQILGISPSTVRAILMKYRAGGLSRALGERPRSGQPLKFDGKQRAQITALACTDAPEGCARWSLVLLANKAVELGIVESISHTHVRRILKKTK